MILYYLSVDTPPHFIWIFDESIIERNCEFIQQDSMNGDSCHFNLTGLTNGQAKKIFNDYFNIMEDCLVCDNELHLENNLPRNISQEDILILETYGDERK